jgi:hypothetical protein
LPENLAGAWSDGSTNAYALSIALSQKAGKTLPWLTIKNAIGGAIAAGFIERVSGAWPCDAGSAQLAEFRIPAARPPGPRPESPGFRAHATLEVNELQDLADKIGDVLGAGAGLQIRIDVGLDVQGVDTLVDDRIDKMNAVLAKVRAGLVLKRQ